MVANQKKAELVHTRWDAGKRAIADKVQAVTGQQREKKMLEKKRTLK